MEPEKKVEDLKSPPKLEVKEFERPKVFERPKTFERPVKVSDHDKTVKLAEEKFAEAKQGGKVFLTIVDKAKNYWNSGDELHFLLIKGRCREIPDEITEVLQHALSEQNRLLKEADDSELMEEMMIRAQEELISQGEIKPPKISDEKLRL